MKAFFQWLADFFANLFKAKDPGVQPLPQVNSGIQAALSWELPCNDGQVNQKAKPERKPWSVKLFGELKRHWSTIGSSSDIKEIIPSHDKLTEDQRITVMAELMSTVAEYESSWNPATTTKDVNGKDDPEYKATGLYQMNAADDQRNYKTGTSYGHSALKDPLVNIEVGVKILTTVVKIRGKILFNKGEKSPVLRYFYATLVKDTTYGAKTINAAQKRIAMMVDGFLKSKEPVAPPATKPSDSPVWFKEAKKYEGKNESDPAFNAAMSKKWSLFGMNLGTIQQSWAAWCGLAVAVALSGVGYDYQKNGALAKNWASYGQEIVWQTDGIPQGAIVQINHTKCGNSSSNHVSMANGDCTADDLKKPSAMIALYGGNQGNTWKTSVYSVKEVCAVRWPKESPKPGKVTKSINCATGKSGTESTR